MTTWLSRQGRAQSLRFGVPVYILVLTRENQGGGINTFSPLPDLSEPSMYTLTPGAVGPSLDDYQPRWEIIIKQKRKDFDGKL